VNRKQRRALAKQQRKKGENDLADKMMLFDKLPEMCTACEKPFDKKDRKMLSTWNVAVRESENRVNLYCPSCWQMAFNMVAAAVEGIQETGEILREREKDKNEK